LKKWRHVPFFCALAAACAVLPTAEDDGSSLARAESAFAAQSVRENMRSAFLAHFAPDGVFVRGAWVNAHQYLAARPAPPIVLDWRPAYVLMARSGDLGLSTGPWKATSRERPNDAPAVGEFVSVWRRDAGGPWQVIVDLGVSHRDPATWNRPLHIERVAAAAPPATTFADAEAEFGRLSATEGLRAAYAAYGSGAMRVLRQGNAPFVGRDAPLAPFVSSSERLQWTVERGETSRAGDFAYARGRYAAAALPSRPVGDYLRVWRVEGHEWRIVLDVTNPR